MKRVLLILSVFLFLSVTACSEKVLTTQEAASFASEHIAKVPVRTVSFYVGPITDPTYLPVYRKIATGKYLTLKEHVYIKAAHKKMPLFEKTKAGDKVLHCRINRCEAPVCKRVLGRVTNIEQHGKHATIHYTVKTVCEGELYKIFKPLADKQYVTPGEETESLNVTLEKGKWIVR